VDTQSECGSASSTDKGLIQILNLSVCQWMCFWPPVSFHWEEAHHCSDTAWSCDYKGQ